mgnify:CR=1 FL=1
MQHFLLIDQIKKDQSRRQWSKDERKEHLKMLRQENQSLRDQTKEINEKLNELIEKSIERNQKALPRKQIKTNFKKGIEECSIV